jgi:hypothetical protein
MKNKDKILDTLNMKIINANGELQGMISNIYGCCGIRLLIEILLNLNYIGQKRIMGILELMLNFSDQTKKIFLLFKKLGSSYNDFTGIIKNKNYQGINSIKLESIEPDSRKKLLMDKMISTAHH